MRKIHVELGPRSYSVLIGMGILQEMAKWMREAGLKHRDAFVITDEVVGGHYFQTLKEGLAAVFRSVVRHEIPAMEEGKNWSEFTRTCEALLGAFPDAAAVPLVVLLGGGVVGDLGGFAAAVFRRGVPFVQVPTTLLAAVDSSVGGKTAVNFGGVKNIMGVFSQPRLVVCDLSVLKSLPPREMRSGMAEIIKYGAVCSRGLFEQLENGALEQVLALDESALVEVVSQCVELKAAVVKKDEEDKLGIRNVLNFGHTVGHALELSVDYALTHGEAIAVGMVAATAMARRLRMVDDEFEKRLHALLMRAGLPLCYTAQPGLLERILRAMRMDKKFRDGKNLFVLPVGLGLWEPRENVPWETVQACVRQVLR